MGKNNLHENIPEG